MSVTPRPESDHAAHAAPPPEPAGSAPEQATAAPGGRRPGRRSLVAALPLGAAGAALVLLAAGKTWARGSADFAQSALPVHATGGETTALPGALALVGLAALVAVFAVRRAGRYAVAGLLALCGLGVVIAALARRTSHGALDAAAARATGLTHATAAHPATTAWPLVAAAGGLLLLTAGLLALVRGRYWPAMSSRYDRAPTARPPRTARPAPVDPDRPEDIWKALDRGEDPTRVLD